MFDFGLEVVKIDFEFVATLAARIGTVIRGEFQSNVRVRKVLDHDHWFEQSSCLLAHGISVQY